MISTRDDLKLLLDEFLCDDNLDSLAISEFLISLSKKNGANIDFAKLASVDWTSKVTILETWSYYGS